MYNVSQWGDSSPLLVPHTFTYRHHSAFKTLNRGGFIFSSWSQLMTFGFISSDWMIRADTMYLSVVDPPTCHQTSFNVCVVLCTLTHSLKRLKTILLFIWCQFCPFSVAHTHGDVFSCFPTVNFSFQQSCTHSLCFSSYQRFGCWHVNSKNKFRFSSK